VKVFITGIAGFLGSHLTEYYRKKGWQVSGIDSMTKYELNRTNFNAEKIRKYQMDFLKSIGAELIIGDICDARLDEFAKDADYIIHCAAQPAMTIALEKPAMSCYHNVLGTVNVLEAAKNLNVPVAICSSIHVYGNGDNEYLDGLIKEKFRYKEDEKLLAGNVTPLHIDKYADELYGAFIESYGMKTAAFRLTGFYGERQFGGEDHGWIANFAIRTELGLPIKVFGTDTQVRDALYVRDVCRAFDNWHENGQPPGIYNIGGGKQITLSIKQCLTYEAGLLAKAQDIEMLPARQGDLWYMVCDITKANKAFGWQPECEWVRNNRGLFE